MRANRPLGETSELGCRAGFMDLIGRTGLLNVGESGSRLVRIRPGFCTVVKVSVLDIVGLDLLPVRMPEERLTELSELLFGAGSIAPGDFGGVVPLPRMTASASRCMRNTGGLRGCPSVQDSFFEKYLWLGLYAHCSGSTGAPLGRLSEERLRTLTPAYGLLELKRLLALNRDPSDTTRWLRRGSCCCGETLTLVLKVSGRRAGHCSGEGVPASASTRVRTALGGLSGLMTCAIGGEGSGFSQCARELALFSGFSS